MKNRQYLAVFQSKHNNLVYHEHRFWCWTNSNILERAWEEVHPEIRMADYELIRIEVLPKSQRDK